MAKISTIQDFLDWKEQQEFNAQRNAPRAVASEEKLITDIGKQFAAGNPNISPERQMAIDEGQRSLTPTSANDPYTASRVARSQDRVTEATNSINSVKESNNNLTPTSQQDIARGASAVANSGGPLEAVKRPDPGSAQAQRELLYKAAKEHGAPNAESYRPPQPGLSTATRSQVEIDALARAAGPPAPPPQPQRSIEKPGPAVSANDQLDRMNAIRSPTTTTRPASTSAELTPYEHDMRALDIIRGDREKRIAQRALVPHATPVDIDKLEKTADLARFKAQSAFDNTTGNSRKKGMAAQIVLDSYKPVLDALAGGGKEENALEKQRLASQADLQSKGNASDARIAAQESRNQMLEKLSKDRLDTQLALANRPRYTPAREEYTDDLGDKVTNIVPFDQSTGTVDRSATGGLSGKQYEAVKEAQRISAKLQDKKPLSKSEQAHWDKWGPTEEIWGKVR